MFRPKLVELRKHDAKLGRVDIFYTFAFDVGGPGRHITLAKKLLKNDVAETAISSRYGEVRVSPRYESLAKLKNRSTMWIMVDEFFNDERIWSQLSVTAKVVVVWLAVRFGLLRKLRSMRSGGVSDATKSHSRPKSTLTETIDFIDNSVGRRQVIAGLMHALDREHFESGYLASEPFIRLELRHFFASGIRLSSSEEQLKFEPAVTLMLHSTGVALLSFDISLPTGVTPRELFLFGSSNSVRLSEVTIAEPVLMAMIQEEGAKKENLAGEWDAEEAEGTRWRTFRHGPEEESTLTDVFITYQSAILSFLNVKNRYEDYLCLKTMNIGGLHCCGSKKIWMLRHVGELAGIASRSKLGTRLRVDKAKEIIGDDYSLTSNKSQYWAGGSVTEIEWEFFGEVDRSIGEHYDSLVVIGSGIVRFWLLRTLDYKLSQMTSQRKKFENLLVEALDGIRFSARSHLSYGSAREVSDLVFDQLGGAQVSASLNFRIDLRQQLISLREAARTSRRTIVLAVGAIVAAIALGLPAVRQSLDVMANLPAGSFGWKAFRFLKGSGTVDSLAWSAYLLGIGCVLAFALVGGLAIHSRLRGSSKNKIGKRWGTGKMSVHLVSRDASDKNSAEVHGD